MSDIQTFFIHQVLQARQHSLESKTLFNIIDGADMFSFQE